MTIQFLNMTKPDILENRKRKEIDTSSFVTNLLKYDTCGSIHTMKEAQKSCDSCDLCMDVMSITDINRIHSRCNHGFCRDCLETYLAKAVQENIHEVECPGSKCKALLSKESCRKYIPEQVFDRWKSCLTECSALGEYQTIVCPFDDCREEFRDDAKRYAMKACPGCFRMFCNRCKVEWHWKMDCRTFQRARLHEFQSRSHHPFFQIPQEGSNFSFDIDNPHHSLVQPRNQIRRRKHKRRAKH